MRSLLGFAIMSVGLFFVVLLNVYDLYYISLYGLEGSGLQFLAEMEYRLAIFNGREPSELAVWVMWLSPWLLVFSGLFLTRDERSTSHRRQRERAAP